MRTGIIVCFLSAVFLSSCTLTELPTEKTHRTDTVRVGVSLNAGAFHTKTDPDESINNVKILVFNASGQRTHWYDSSTSDLGCLEVPGRKPISIYALVNAPGDFSSVTTLDQLLARRSNISDNTRTSLVMVGHVDTTLTADCAVVIPVRRMAAKIVVDELYCSFLGCGNAEPDEHQIKSIQIRNGSGDWPYALDEGSSTWTVESTAGNMVGYVWSFNPYWTTRTVGDRTYYYYGEQTVYAYPNHQTQKDRRTRLTLQVQGMRLEEVGENSYQQYDCYHYISYILPRLDANTLYRIARITLYQQSYEANPAQAKRELYVTASAQVESFDMLTGRMTGQYTLEEPSYVEEIVY